MNNNLKTALIALGVALVVVVGLWLVNGQSIGFGGIGATFFPNSGVGARSFKVVTSTKDNTPAADGVISVGGGSASILNLCVSATWNPGSLSADGTSTAATSTDIAFTGLVVGDTCNASLSSATTTSARVNCLVATNATATVTLANVSNAALDLATGTAKFCISR